MPIPSMPRHRQRVVHHTLTLVFPGLQAAIGVLLLAGLSGCGQASSDPSGWTPPDAPLKPTITPTSSYQNRVLNTETGSSLQSSSPSAPERSTTDTRPRSSAAPETAHPTPTEAPRQQWFGEARAHPEVTVRRQALELWAEQPTQNLDPVTYALVDGDESVRTRAQELYEQQLVRESAEAHPTTDEQSQ